MKPIKGVILAGGLGKRLYPLTKVTNKHLLPIYNKPMIFYPLETLVKAGVTDVLLVTGGNDAGDFLRLLGNGKDFGLKELHYTYQEGEGGIAAALLLAEDFADKGPIVVILGDNVFKDDIRPGLEHFRKQSRGAKIFLKKVPDPQRFGVPILNGRKVIKIEEKPKSPKSPYAVTGIYIYDETVFGIIQTLKPSGRGELEITDVNNKYIDSGLMTYEVLKHWWTDAGTLESLHKANNLVAEERTVEIAAELPVAKKKK